MVLVGGILLFIVSCGEDKAEKTTQEQIDEIRKLAKEAERQAKEDEIKAKLNLTDADFDALKEALE